MATAVASNELPEQADEAGARLYEEHAETLLRYCRRRLGSEVEAEDAVQTTFVYALRALRRGVVPECEEAWLTTIARNVCHWQRRTQARRGSLATGIDLDAFPSLGTEPGDHDELIGLDDALASMPEQQRRALVLREWRGAAPSEIALKLDLTPTATHALLTRARASLALALTVARQPALAVLWLVGELRSLVKAIVGSASAKAGVAAVTVVATTGVTAGLVDRSEHARSAEAATPVLVDPRPARRAETQTASRGAARAVSTLAAPQRVASGARARPASARRDATVRRQPAPPAGATPVVQPPQSATPRASETPSSTERAAAGPTSSTPAPPSASVPRLPVTPKLPAAPKLPLPVVPKVPEVAPPHLPDISTVPVPPVVEGLQTPPVPETVAEAKDVVRQTTTSVLP